MKKINIAFISLLIGASTFSSCDFLNVSEDYFSDEMSSDSLFANKRNAEAYMWDISRMFLMREHLLRPLLPQWDTLQPMKLSLLQEKQVSPLS